MRTKKFASAMLLLATLALTGAGCGQKASVTDSGTSRPSSNTSSDTCGNPYYPFKPGMAIAYSVSPSSGAVGDSDYTNRVLSVSGTKASIRVEMANGANTDMEADCASGSVSMKGSSGLAALEGTKFETTVLESSGTFMPANVRVGTTWSNSQTVEMKLTEGEVAGANKIISTTAEDSKAVSEESITVPAGTYKAMKVEITRTTSTKFVSAPGGSTLPDMPPSVATSTEWWVKGIGMVKSVTITDGNTSTREAKSVSGL